MRARGFTLVEVMVALAIVAIALPAVLMSLYQQIDDTAYLRDKTTAQMVAANKLAEMRLVIASTRVLTTGKDNGVAAMADRDWHWWVETKPTELPKFLRTEIRVALEDEQAQGEQPPEYPLYTLTAFMSSDLRIDTSAPPENPGDPPDPGDPTDPSQPNAPDPNPNLPPDLPTDLPVDLPTDGN